MKSISKLGFIVFFGLSGFYGLYMHSLSMMGVSDTFAQEADNEADSDHDHISGSSTTFKGFIFHITHPGFPTASQRIVEANTAPPGPWILQGAWKLKVDQAAETVTNFEANLSMVRVVEPGAEELIGGGTLRSWHAMQISVQTGTVVNEDGESLHVNGIATVASNGNEQFGEEPVEIILGGGGAVNPATIAVWFDTDPEEITNSLFIEGSLAPKNARAHFGGGTIWNG